jgi:hypothetical protein
VVGFHPITVQVNKAYHLGNEQGDVKYRFVIDMASFKQTS